MRKTLRKIFYDADGDDNYVWPKKGQHLLKEPEDSTPKELTAHLDWLKTFNRDDLGMPEAYKQGGDYLVEALKKGETARIRTVLSFRFCISTDTQQSFD